MSTFSEEKVHFLKWNLFEMQFFKVEAFVSRIENFTREPSQQVVKISQLSIYIYFKTFHNFDNLRQQEYFPVF
jgi:hypothetical protein